MKLEQKFNYVVALLFAMEELSYFLPTLISNGKVSLETHIILIVYIALVVIGFLLQNKYLIVIGFVLKLIEIISVILNAINVVNSSLAYNTTYLQALQFSLILCILDCLYLAFYFIAIIMETEQTLYLSLLFYVIQFIDRVTIIHPTNIVPFLRVLVIAFAVILTKNTFIFYNKEKKE